MHNESNVFHQEDYTSKLKFPIAVPKRSIAPEPASLVNTDAFSPAEIEHIKRLNHNFSDVFGLEYGSREGVKKSPTRTFSPKLEWDHVDSIKNRRDVGDQKTVTLLIDFVVGEMPFTGDGLTLLPRHALRVR